MAALPLADDDGNELTAFWSAGQARAGHAGARAPMPLSLTVVICGGQVLFLLSSYRHHWELPGGMREPGERPRDAAIRELAEETGIVTTSLGFAGIAGFRLGRPTREERAAVYYTILDTRPPLTVNDEAADFCWLAPAGPSRPGFSPCDTEIAHRVTQALQTKTKPAGTGSIV